MLILQVTHTYTPDKIDDMALAMALLATRNGVVVETSISSFSRKRTIIVSPGEEFIAVKGRVWTAFAECGLCTPPGT